MKNHLYQTKDGLLHLCDKTKAHPGIVLVWTKCEKDVPANASFESEEDATCPKCVADSNAKSDGEREMGRASTCTTCGSKTNTYIKGGGLMVCPGCARAEEACMFLVGINSQAELDSWYKKFQPNKTAPTIRADSKEYSTDEK